MTSAICLRRRSAALRAREGSELAAVDEHLAGRLALEAREQVQQRRLSAPGAAHDRGERACVELPGETVEHRAARARESHDDVAQLGRNRPLGGRPPLERHGLGEPLGGGPGRGLDQDALSLQPGLEAPRAAERVEQRVGQADPARLA